MSIIQLIVYILTRYWPVGLPIFVFIFVFVMWFKKGKDPKIIGPVVPEYSIPDNLSPLEVAIIFKQHLADKEIASEIIYLATRGYIKLCPTQKDYALTLLKKSKTLHNEFEVYFLDVLFPTGAPGSVVQLSKFRSKFSAHMLHIKKLVSESVVTKGYYPFDPQKAISRYFGFGVIVFFVAWFLGMLRVISGYGIASIVLSGFIILGFNALTPIVTRKGVLIRQKIRGLDLYMSSTDKDFDISYSAPEKRPELFEKLLPFALMLGEETAWAKKFESVYTYPPQWYCHPGHGGFNVMTFVHALSAFSTNVSFVLSSNRMRGPVGAGVGSGGNGG